MDINIEQQPPGNIPHLRRHYRRAALLCLGTIACSLVMGTAAVFSDTRYDSILEYAAFALFVTSGFVFVYFTEKLMGYRRLGPKQKKQLSVLREKNAAIEQYCRQVTAQGRYLVVNEFEAILAHWEKIQGRGAGLGSAP